MSRVCLVTLDTPEIAFHAGPMQENKRLYAQRWGYDFLHVTRKLFPESVPASYSKLLAVQQCFRAGYDCVVWADADVCFTNFTRNIVDLCDGERMAALRQIPDRTVCFGLAVLPNNERIWLMIHSAVKWVESGYHTNEHPWEQAFINTHLSLCPDDCNFCAEEEIGSFWPELKNAPVVRPWRKGDLTIHMGLAEWHLRHGLWVSKYQPEIVW